VKVTKPMLLRIFADAVMVSLAFALAFSIRYMSVTWSVPGLRESLLRTYIDVYRDFAWLLTLESLVIFYSSGFYTYGRTYHSRYKALVIFQAVSIAYLLFGFTLFFFRVAFPLPRSVLITGWLLTLCLVGALRFLVTLVIAAFAPEAAAQERVVLAKLRNVLLLGGAGYLGSTLVRKLLERNYHVRVLDILAYGKSSLAELQGMPGFELVEGDFRHIGTVVQCVKGMDAVVHLGAIVGDPASKIDKELTVDINLAATKMVAGVSRGYGVQRFIFASTCSVYGASDETLSERSVLKPISLYALTKMQSEEALLILSDASFAPTILRFATIYGLSPRPRFDLVVNFLAAKAIRDGEITIYGGEQWRPFIHVDDAAEAVIKCLEAPLEKVKRQIYNVGSNGQNYQIHRIGQIIKQVLPQTEIVTDSRKVDARNYRVSFDKIQRELNLRPQKSVEDAILEIRDAIQQGQITDFQRPEYSNYEFLVTEEPLRISELAVMSRLLEE